MLYEYIAPLKLYYYIVLRHEFVLNVLNGLKATTATAYLQNEATK